MGVKIRFLKGAWWVVIHQHGRRKMKRVGDRETADRVDAFTSAPPSGNTTGTVATFTPKAARVRRRTDSERDQSGITGVWRRRRDTAKS